MDPDFHDLKKMWAFPLITLPGSLCVKFYKGIDMFALDSGDLNSNY